MPPIEPVRYTTKPITIEAMEFDGQWGTALRIMRWGTGIYFVPEGYEHALRYESEYDIVDGHVRDSAPSFLVIETLEGPMRADRGDQIIKGTRGEFYPCKPKPFSDKYQRVSDGIVSSSNVTEGTSNE